MLQEYEDELPGSEKHQAGEGVKNLPSIGTVADASEQADVTAFQPVLSVIIAARNEEAYIGRCLAALVAQEEVSGGPVEVIVVANACTDSTVDKAVEMAAAFRSRGWMLSVVDLVEGGKTGALNAADALAIGNSSVYLDADVLCEPTILARIQTSLNTNEPRYATGRLVVMEAESAVTQAYARIWTRLPFVTDGAVGAGLFAVNAQGRQRWKDWPSIISDDTFARLNFTAEERTEVPARYHWPMVEGFTNLVRVRRRQDAGVAEIYDLYPQLRVNEAKSPVTVGLLIRLALTDPLGFATFIAVSLVVRLKPKTGDWTRGR